MSAVLINVKESDPTEDPPRPAALGDGHANDTDAIQRAIKTAARSLGTVYFPPGIYRIIRPLSIRASSDPAVDRRQQYGIKLIGSSAMASATSPTSAVLMWDPDSAATDQPMLQLWSRECIIDGLQFRVQAGKSCCAAIQWTQDPAPGALACTRVNLRNCRIYNDPGSGTFKYGITVGDDVGRGFPFNMDFLYCDDVSFGPGVIDSCVYVPNTTGQAKAHNFSRCTFDTAKYGLNYESGSFTTDQCNFTGLSEGCLRLVRSTDFIAVRDSDSEECKRLIVAEGSQAAGWPVLIDGGRFASDIADEYVNWRWPGPLTFRGVLFEPYNPLWCVTWDAPFQTLDVPIIMFDGCTLPNAYPIQEDAAGTDIKISFRGCNAEKVTLTNNQPGSELTPLPDSDPYEGTRYKSYTDVSGDAETTVLEFPIRYSFRMYRLEVDVLARNTSTSVDAATWKLRCGLLTFGGAPVPMGGAVKQVDHEATANATGWTAAVEFDTFPHSVSPVTQPNPGTGRQFPPVIGAKAFPPQAFTYDTQTRIEITDTGLLGTSTFRISLDSGIGWSGSRLTPTSGSYVIGSLGLELTFAAGSYVKGDVYTFTTVVPKCRVRVRGQQAQNTRWQIMAKLLVGH
ncbi:MAG: glycosyl hydrolase family 28-related protein [Pseudonocardiaceae bacterium]